MRVGHFYMTERSVKNLTIKRRARARLLITYRLVSYASRAPFAATCDEGTAAFLAPASPSYFAFVILTIETMTIASMMAPRMRPRYAAARSDAWGEDMG